MCTDLRVAAGMDGQVHPEAAYLVPRRPDLGSFPVDDAGQHRADEQEIAEIEVAMAERTSGRPGLAPETPGPLDANEILTMADRRPKLLCSRSET